MNNIQEIINFRNEFIAKLKSPSLDTDVLRNLIINCVQDISLVFESHKNDGVVDPLLENKSNWSEDYFIHQCVMAKSNFSENRIMHLIDVRDYLKSINSIYFHNTTPVSSVGNDHIIKNTTDIDNFTPGDSLKNIVARGKLSLTRVSLAGELEDPRLDSSYLTNAMNWTEGKSPNLFEDYDKLTDEGSINPNMSQWSGDYYFSQLAYLKHNFSRKRFEHLIAVRAELRRQGIKGFETAAVKKTVAQPSTHRAKQNGPSAQGSHQQHCSSPTPSWLKTALVAGGVIAVLAALLKAIL